MVKASGSDLTYFKVVIEEEVATRVVHYDRR